MQWQVQSRISIVWLLLLLKQLPWTSGGGYGCTKCMRKTVDGKTVVNRGPGVCGFDCFFCGCDCKCVFMEHNRQKIAAGIAWEKVWLEKQGNASKSRGSDPSPGEIGRSTWTQYIMTEIDNPNVQENQQVDEALRTSFFRTWQLWLQLMLTPIRSWRPIQTSPGGFGR